MDQARRGGRALSDSPPLTVLATPILGAPLTRDLVSRIESVEGVQCAQIAADGRIHGDADEAAFKDAEVLLLGSVPASVLDHVVTRSARLRWIHSASAGVDRVTTPVVPSRDTHSPSARRREARDTLTTAGIPYSRAVAAACCPSVPSSNIKPPKMGKKGVHKGPALVATRISPAWIST